MLSLPAYAALSAAAGAAVVAHAFATRAQ